ncbi:hypothetical protein OAN307_c24380 [Octadecabacter antarcticus 307]|uniref:Uncharacterized protein n=1 Tax=Octadecabacter antarcticus 307 TaxID=391626 RepID=M9R750_9RHOB|nr:hypothetical protein OAN307_c24380 [Octadecabacter antarcticus 307]
MRKCGWHVPRSYAQAYVLLKDNPHNPHNPPWRYLYNPLDAIGLRSNQAGFHILVDGVLDVARLAVIT